MEEFGIESKAPIFFESAYEKIKKIETASISVHFLNVSEFLKTATGNVIVRRMTTPMAKMLDRVVMDNGWRILCE